MSRRLLTLSLIAPLVALVLLAITGGLGVSEIVGLPDPGAVVRVGLPLVQAVRDLGALLTVGLLVLASCCVPPDPDRPSLLTGARARLRPAIALSAGCWLLGSLLLILLSQADATGRGLGGTSWAVLETYVRGFDQGRYLAAGAIISAAVLVGVRFVRGIGGLGFLTVVALAGLWPLGLAGHAAGTLGHDKAVELQAMHLLGISVWMGGLAGLLLIHRSLGADLVPTLRRYSSLAGISLVLVAVSGLWGAVLRVPEVGDLATAYGFLLLVKVLLITALAGLGWWQRGRLIDQAAAGRPGTMLRVALLEIAVLATAAGAGVALGRTAPPASLLDRPSPAGSLLGSTPPPPLGAAEWFTQWRIDVLWLTIAGLAIFGYLAGVRRLRKRGDAWPVLRSLTWVVGWLLLLWATCGAPGVYGRVLFSMHMIQHMTLATAVPVLLVLGAPVTLALRAVKRRQDGSRGPREWLQVTVHSRYLAVLSHPVVACGLFVVSLVAFYYSGLFEMSLRTHTGHQLMMVHFLLVGYLFVNCLVGLDPGPQRPAHPIRLLLLMVTFAFHAFFSVSLMAMDTVLAAQWYDDLNQSWSTSALVDQELGGSLGWALGELPLLVLVLALLASWVRTDRHERDRHDRQAARDGDQELGDYNDYLARLAAHDRGDRG